MGKGCLGARSGRIAHRTHLRPAARGAREPAARDGSWPFAPRRALPRPVRSASLAFAALTTTLSLAAGAFPGSAPQHAGSDRIARAGTLGPAALRFGRSLGSPTEGHLLGGAHLAETEYLRIEPDDAGGDVRWGLEPLVAMLNRAAYAVRQRFPGAIMSVGHLSREGGGDVDRHRSHESGRDADVVFFVRSASGKQLLSSHFVSFRADGAAPTWPGAYFDDARNWMLVSTFVSDAEAHVTHLFVASPLRARLLAYAERIGAPSSVRMRAAELMEQPRGVLPHDDHFHVRIACPAHMSGCVENPTTHAGRSLPAPLGRGHRSEAATRALVTPAPKRASQPAAAPPASAPPSEAPSPPVEPTTTPAAAPRPIDDVDG
jgi:penicillin-insensitive murein DD-endopeptidase